MSGPTPSLDTLEGCQHFVQASSPEEIAAQLHRDRDTCRQNAFPSLLAHVVSARDDKIAIALQNDPRLPLPVLRMLYSNTLSTIKNHMASISHDPLAEETNPRSHIPEHLVPTNEEFNAALKVLRYMQLPQVKAIPSTSTSVEEVVQLIHGYLEDGIWVKRKKRRANKLCYICRYTAKHPHRLYPSLCNPCGEFNVSSSALSLPTNLDLTGKVAVVTGGRVNLGYHTALRMLRCGASVVVSSRYPYDAETRYAAEPDFGVWKGRLKVVGADFRTAKDVFALVEAIKACLEEWGSSVLHVLINNAAQTLTDSVEKEDESIRREQLLLHDSPAGVVMENRYQARIRGGHKEYLLQPSKERQLLIAGPEVATKQDEVATEVAIKSSWTQSISEIPYEDVISAHSVNTFVPFILLRELLPLMPPRPPPPSQPPAISKPMIPLGYVINVSSREGLFERSPNSSSKSGLHVHTNMSKAALNMLTETEAASAWRKKRVSINSVDPGYMSADPMFMEMLGRTGEPCPIGWEDGAGRVLWPIAKDTDVAFWEGGECLKNFPDRTYGEEWERNHEIPLVLPETSASSPTESEYPMFPTPSPPSPTPSFVRFFEGQCLCEHCSPNGPIVYSAETEAEKRKLYAVWKLEQGRKWKEKVSQHREKFLSDLIFRRKRALMVVNEAFGLDDVDAYDWDEESYGRWWEATRRRFEEVEEADTTQWGPNSLPFDYGF